MKDILDITINGVEYFAIRKDSLNFDLKFSAILNRFEDDGVQTLGELQIYLGKSKIFECKTLELPWNNNSPQISCIPKGSYRVKPYTSPSKGDVYLLVDVPGRDMIEIHVGNYHTDIQGCILVGEEFKYINSDNELDVTNSRKTFEKLKKVLNYKEFILVIK